MGLVVALCRLPPPSSSSLLSNAAATPPKTESPPLRPPFSSPPAILPLPPPPPRRLPALSTLSIAHGAILDWHASSTPSGTTRRGAPLVKRRANCASAAVTAAAMPRSPLRRPELDPPSLIGPPPPVGRRRRQHVDVDARPWHLRHRIISIVRGSWSGLWNVFLGCFHGVLLSSYWVVFFFVCVCLCCVCRLFLCGGTRRQSRATYVASTKCVQVSLSETCKFLHPSCMKTCNAFALHVFMQLGCTQYEIHEFQREHVQRKSVARKRATLLRCTCTNLHGACTELARSLQANL